MTLRWLGHATVLIALDGVRLLTDPVLRNRIGPLVRVAAPVSDGLGALDAVLLSHLHADHADLRSLRRVARRAPVLAPYPAGTWLRNRGIGGALELRRGDETRIGPVGVTAIAASHEPRRWRFGPAADPIGYLISGSASVYFAGDTDLCAEMSDLRGSVQLALVPIWGWGRSVGTGHLDPKRAALAVALIAPEVAIPIHWGTFAVLGRAPRRAELERPAVEFVALARRYAPTVRVKVLAPGEAICL